MSHPSTRMNNNFNQQKENSIFSYQLSKRTSNDY
jgi:hypothetical protein